MSLSYIPFYTQIWSDKKFKKLSAHAQLMFIYLFGNSQITLSGIYNLDLEIMKIKIKINDAFEEIFQEIITSKMIEWDNEEEVVFVINRFKLQPNNKSPKIITGVISELDIINHPFKAKFIKIYANELKEYIWRFKDYKLTKEEAGTENFIKDAAKLFNTRTDLKKFVMDKGVNEQRIDEILNKMMPNMKH